MLSVWRVRVVPSSRAQCTKNVHPLVLSVFSFYVFFSFENRRPHAEPRVSEKQNEKKCALMSSGLFSGGYVI